MPRQERTAPNISINKRNFDLLEQQQQVFPALTKGDLVNNILDIYFKGTGSWCPKKVDKEEDNEQDWEKEIKDFVKLQDTLKETFDKPVCKNSKKSKSTKKGKEKHTRKLRQSFK